MENAISRYLRPSRFPLLGLIALLCLILTGRVSADTAYLYYSENTWQNSSDHYYRYDQLMDTWEVDYELDDNWTLLEEPPPYPGDLVGGQDWEIGSSYGAYNAFSVNSSFYYRFAYDPNSDKWYMNWVGNSGWYPWADPDGPNDYLYYYNVAGAKSIKYDTINGLEWENLVGDYIYCDYVPNGIGAVDPGYLITGDNWSYTNVNSVDYAYDTVSGVWYVDTGYNSDIGFDVWEETTSPI